MLNKWCIITLYDYILLCHMKYHLKKSIHVWIYIWVLCTMVNNANMNSHVEISRWTYFLGINLRVEFLGQW